MRDASCPGLRTFRPPPHARGQDGNHNRRTRRTTPACVITTFLGVGLLSTLQPLPMDRVYLVNPGQQVTIDAPLAAVPRSLRPPHPAHDNHLVLSRTPGHRWRDG
jgi:hypothetical protein